MTRVLATQTRANLALKERNATPNLKRSNFTQLLPLKSGLRPHKIMRRLTPLRLQWIVRLMRRPAPVEHPLRISQGQIKIRAAKQLATSLFVS